MVIKTFGTGGTYATAKAAWDSHGWTDDVTILQVGDSSGDGGLTHKNQNGYTAIFIGSPDHTISTNGSFSFLSLSSGATCTGSIIIEWLGNLVSGGLIENEHIYINFTGSTLSSFRFAYRYSYLTLNSKSGIKINDNSSGFAAIDIYGTDTTMTEPSFASAIIDISANTSSKIPTGCRISIEDNLFYKSVSTGHICFSAALTSYDGSIICRRNYLNGFLSDQTANTGALGAISNITTDTYTSASDTNLTTSHTLLAFSTDNFLSVSSVDARYGMPRADSVLFLDATQTSEITDNIVGLNGVTVSQRAAGPYTPEEYIFPPTNIARTEENDGQKVTWNDTLQPSYPRTAIYWEEVEPESAFVSYKAIIEAGVEEYTIPYPSLAGAYISYVRLTHIA